MAAFAALVWINLPKRPSKVVGLVGEIEAVEYLKQWCAAMVEQRRNRARTIEARLLPMFLHSSEVVRALEIAFESLFIIERTKSAETLSSRLEVALNNVREAHGLAPHVFDDGQRDALIELLKGTSSASWTRIAVARIESLAAKAAAAKTDKTRFKYQQAASDYGKQALAEFAILPADRERIIAAIPVGTEPPPRQIPGP